MRTIGRPLLSLAMSVLLCMSMLGVPIGGAFASNVSEGAGGQEAAAVQDSASSDATESTGSGTETDSAGDSAEGNRESGSETASSDEADTASSEPLQDSTVEPATSAEVPSGEDSADDGSNPDEGKESAQEGDVEDIAFLYVDQSLVSLGAEQNIVVSLASGGDGVERAILHYSNSDSGEAYTAEASRLNGMDMLFAFSPDSPGAYMLDSLDVWVGDSDTPVTYSLASLSGAFFDVEQEGAEQDAEESSVFTLDDSGALVESESVEEALESSDVLTMSEPAAESAPNAIQPRSVSGKIVIALDPGHGGSDPGAVANGLRECDINWSIAQACKKKLESYGRYTVVLTRTKNECPSLAERVRRAANAGAHLFVSIHINSGGGTGSEVYIPNDSSYLKAQTQGVAEPVAKSILAKLKALGLKNRGVKQKDWGGSDPERYEDGSVCDYYGVIRESRYRGIPGMIVEHAFVDNSSDASKLASSSFLTKLGNADAEGIASSFTFANNGVTVEGSDFVKGKPITFSANVVGETSGLTYNYAWSYQGKWETWGSTVKDTGHRTSATSGSFTPTKIGDYYLWVDIVRADGTTQTTLQKKISVSGDWSASGVSAPSTAKVGQSVSWSAEVSGPDSGSLTYSYAWRYGTGWSLWGSTLKDTGSTTSARSGSFTPTKAGTWYVWVDVRDASGRTVTTDAHAVRVTASYPIMGASQTNVEQMIRRFDAAGHSYPSTVYASKGAATIRDFCAILVEESIAEGVRPEVVFAQAMHETGWLQFGGDVQASQCNFGGLGATGGGASGATFGDVRTGLRAQVQHLKAYASTDSLNNAVVDPRFSYVSRGSAPFVEDLTGRWASDSNYGVALIKEIDALLEA